ncbi:MAG: hypothetical protein SFX73_28470 [Kofleriaceae bacterium]|nr:hypothetical protein [Kofleriaceae bacterium]
MIATRRGLAILAVVNLLLLSLFVVDRRDAPGLVDRALVAGLDVASVTALRWDDGGKPVLGIARQSPGEGAEEATPWRFTAPAYGDVEAAAIANLLATLRGARWHRRDAAAAAGPHPRSLVITAGGHDHVLAFGRVLDGGEQVWLVSGDDAILVDAWVARALDPGALGLVIRRPFEGAARAPIVVGDRHLDGAPRRLQPSGVIVAASVAAELEQALEALALERLVATPVPVPDALVLGVGGVRGKLGGACPGAPALVQLETSIVSGCVAAAAADRVRTAATPLTTTEVVEPRLVPVTPTRIVLADGGVLDLQKRALVDGAAADASRVAELLAVLAAPTERIADRRFDKPRGTITVDYAGGRLVLSLFADGLVRRNSEPHLFQLTDAAWAILGRPAGELRDLALWAEDPTTLARIDIDAITYQRGLVVGEWTRLPSGTADARAVERLAAQLAAPRAQAADAPTFTPRHRVTITVSPPAGPPSSHTLELGALTPKGCPARANGVRVLLDRALCTAIIALAK